MERSESEAGKGAGHGRGDPRAKGSHSWPAHGHAPREDAEQDSAFLLEFEVISQSSGEKY